MIAWLVETLVVTTGLMLLVLVIRDPVRQTFGSHAAYALWALPALRMILPPLGALLPAGIPVGAVTHTSGAMANLVETRIVVQMVADTAPALSGTGSAGAAADSNWPLLLAALWAIGLAFFAVHHYLAYRRFCGFILSEATLREELAPGVTLVSSPRARGPMAFGLRRRFIVFPEDADKRFDAEERAMALAHELAHHARGDLVANAFALVILTLHWCNPVAWIAYRAFRTDQEMACDADVIDAVRGSHLGHAYGRALVKSASGHEFAAACNLTTVDRLKRRLAMLSNKSPSNRRRRTGILLAGAVVLSGLVLTASGEGMAAQVGARVSDALPIPTLDSRLVRDVLPSLPAVPALPALPVLHAADADAAKPKEEKRVRQVVIMTSSGGGRSIPCAARSAGTARTGCLACAARPAGTACAARTGCRAAAAVSAPATASAQRDGGWQGPSVQDRQPGLSRRRAGQRRHVADVGARPGDRDERVVRAGQGAGLPDRGDCHPGRQDAQAHQGPHLPARHCRAGPFGPARGTEQPARGARRARPGESALRSRARRRPGEYRPQHCPPRSGEERQVTG